MKQFTTLLLLALCMLAASCNGQNGTQQTEVLLETTAGNIRLRLYDDTPGHRDNFIQNVKDGMYDGVTFHRIIRGFMVQTGDPDTRTGNHPKVEPDNDSVLGPSIPAEIAYPKYIHRNGVLAAAREGDDINPEKRSSRYQFYIVTGAIQTDDALQNFEQARTQAAIEQRYQQLIDTEREQLDAIRRDEGKDRQMRRLNVLHDQAETDVYANPPKPYSQEQKRAYRMYGGAPWLDGEYTIFGEVVEGMAIVKLIEKTRTDKSDRPLADIRIIKASVVE